MNCPKCKWSTKVIDSREVEGGKEIRRRRECEKCWHRFTTYERPQIARFVVIKSNWEKELYDREKLESSILKAINKTSLDVEQIENMLVELESEWVKNKKWVTSKRIWKDVLDKLEKMSEVAAIRYASVYYGFDKKECFLDYIFEKLYWLWEQFSQWIKEKIKLLKKPSFRRKIKPGEIYYANLGYNVGWEIDKIRPVLVVSSSGFNKTDNILVVPIKTYKDKMYRNYILLDEKIEGLPNKSVLEMMQLRSISKKRLLSYVGRVSKNILEKVNEKINEIIKKPS